MFGSCIKCHKQLWESNLLRRDDTADLQDFPALRAGLLPERVDHRCAAGDETF